MASGAGSRPAHRPQATRIIVITHGQASDPFWSVVKNGVDDAAELMGVEVQYQAPQTFDMVAMAQLIDAAVASKPDGLVVSIPDARRARRTRSGPRSRPGIPVISMDSGLDVSKELGRAAAHGDRRVSVGLRRRREDEGARQDHRRLRQHGGRQRRPRPALPGVRRRAGRQLPGHRHLDRPDRDQGRRDRLSAAAPRGRRRADLRLSAFDPTLAAIEEAGLARADRARLVRPVAVHARRRSTRAGRCSASTPSSTSPATIR